MFVHDLIETAMDKIIKAKRETDSDRSQDLINQGLDELMEARMILQSADGIEAQRRSNILVFPRRKTDESK